MRVATQPNRWEYLPGLLRHPNNPWEINPL